jgi:chromosome partitioning protein
MSVPVIAFFNNKGGVGKTTLVYHLAWMYAELGLRVVAADLDPQANLTAGFVPEDRLEELWPDAEHPETVYGCLRPLIRGVGDIADPHTEPIIDGLRVIVGDLALSQFEDELAAQWPRSMDGEERAFRVLSAFWRLVQRGALAASAEVILVDLGPNLGAINRAALIAADYVVVPLSPDLFSLQGLRNLGPTLRRWRVQWNERIAKNPDPGLSLPAGRMEPVGYIVLQHSVRLDRPVRAYDRWIVRVPEVYHSAVLDEVLPFHVSEGEDSSKIALLKHYRSLMPLAQEARKPMFNLKPADGAIGAHVSAVQNARKDFEALALELASRTGLRLP